VLNLVISPQGARQPFDAVPLLSEYPARHNAAFQAFVSAICDHFPTVAKVVGSQAMQAIATAFVEDCPPSGPISLGFGAELPDWLNSQPLANDLPAIGSFAQIDRMQIEAQLAPDAPEFDLEGLATLRADEWARCRVALHPSARLGWFPDAAPSAWLALNDRACCDLDQNNVSEGIILARRKGKVDALVIDACEHRILHGLRLGETVSKAAIAAANLYPEANITRSFRKIVASGALTTPRIQGAN